MGDDEVVVATRQRLQDAAEELFGERGYEGTSLRALAEAAGANVAAVNYHYGSKEGLLRAVVARAMEPVNAERNQRLTALQAGSAEPSIEQIVRVFVEPGFELVDRQGDRTASVARFVGRVLFDPSPRIRQLFADQVDPVEGRFYKALRHALADRDTATVRLGYASMVGLLALHQAGSFADLQPGRARSRRGGNLDVERERLIAFLVAGMTGGSETGRNAGTAMEAEGDTARKKPSHAG